MNVLMPQLGETVAEGKITTWFKSVGDAVRPGDNLFEIETDKVSMEVPATSPGVISEIRVPAGEVALVGAVVAVIGDKAGAVTSPQAATTGAPPKTPLAPPRAAAPVADAPPPQPRASKPAVLDPFFEVRTPERNFGPAKLASGAVSRRSPAAWPARTASILSPAGLRTARPHRRPRCRSGRCAWQRRAGAGRAIRSLGRSGQGALSGRALRGSAARRHAPHHRGAADPGQADHSALLFDRGHRDRTPAGPARRGQRGGLKDKDGNPAFKLSLNDFVIKALALALQRVPDANAVWAEDRILRFKHSDIGVAVAIEGGLITPVIRQARRNRSLRFPPR